ncbi:hypothetical protein Bca101_081156 [Brassica carinata]
MEGEIRWDAKKKYDQGNVAEEATETITPEWVLKLMKKYEGYDANQMIELKEIKATDLDLNQGRLSMPKHVDRCFLKDGELGTLAAVPKKGVNCLFIDTNGVKFNVELRDWANGLVLTKGWGSVINKNAFEVGQKYPLWCFRSRNDKLCFTLVKPNPVDPIEVLPNIDNKDAKKLSETEVEEVANKNDPESSFSFYAQEMVNHVSGTAAFNLAEVEKNLELVKEAAVLRDRMIELAEQAELNLLLAEELHEACK